MSQFVESTPVQKPEPDKKNKRRILLFSIISLLNVGLLVLIISQLLIPASQPGSHTLIGHSAPGFSLNAVDAQNKDRVLSLSNFQGKPVVLNFWASWCDPCKEEVPLLESTWQQLQRERKDTIFLGIDFEETTSAEKSFAQTYTITYPLTLDSNGSVANEYQIVSLPDTIFINRQGIVVSKVAQQLTPQLLSENLQKII